MFHCGRYIRGQDRGSGVRGGLTGLTGQAGKQWRRRTGAQAGSGRKPRLEPADPPGASGPAWSQRTGREPADRPGTSCATAPVREVPAHVNSDDPATPLIGTLITQRGGPLVRRGVDVARGTEEVGWAWRRRNVGGRIYLGGRDQSGRGCVRIKRMRGRIARPGGTGPSGAGRPGRARRASTQAAGARRAGARRAGARRARAGLGGSRRAGGTG